MKTISYVLNKDGSHTVTESNQPECELGRRAREFAERNPGQVVCGIQATDRGEVKFDRVDLLDNMTGGGSIDNIDNEVE